MFRRDLIDINIFVAEMVNVLDKLIRRAVFKVAGIAVACHWFTFTGSYIALQRFAKYVDKRAVAREKRRILANVLGHPTASDV